MSVGKQDETVIVKWFPGESTAVDGTGITSASLPVSKSNDAATLASAESYADGILVLARGEIAASGVGILRSAEAYTDVLHTRLVASGVLPV